jgi:hypothetical protein
MKEGGLLQMLVLEMHKCLDLSSLSFITLLLLDNLLKLLLLTSSFLWMWLLLVQTRLLLLQWLLLKNPHLLLLKGHS